MLTGSDRLLPISQRRINVLLTWTRHAFLPAAPLTVLVGGTFTTAHEPRVKAHAKDTGRVQMLKVVQSSARLG